MKQLILVLILSAYSLNAFTSDDHGAAEGPANFGDGKAVTAFDKEEGFQLSDKAMKNLRVKFIDIKGNGPWTIPSEALVRVKQSTGVYRRYEKWISFVLVKVISKNEKISQVTSEDLQSGDEIATSGANYLRMTDADLNSGTVDSCAN